MDQKTKSIIVGALGLLVIASVLTIIIYLSKVSKGPTGDQADSSLSRLPTTTVSPPPASVPATGQANLKTYVGRGFSFQYDKNWGLLTCNNSQNIELDPLSSTDQKDVTCNYAVRPVTIMVNDGQRCGGDTITLGPNQVIRFKTVQPDTTYRWCLTVKGVNLDITHRVSPAGGQATSKEDFSSLVEDMIKTIRPTPAGS